MFNKITSLFDFNARELNKLSGTLAAINKWEDELRSWEDEAFVKKTRQWQKQLQEDEITLEEIVPQAFAMVREAARRTLGMRHFDTQLMGGLVLFSGKVGEQKTGEGKTLTATTALYTRALMGKGAHLVTVNDYLARRDAGWMGNVFDFLGLSTAAMISDVSYLFDKNFVAPDVADARLAHLKPISRKEAYAADITYGINSEFGFDYLRDNMAQSVEQQVQRGYYFAIVDECDSVLIDEARTPHIISAPYEQDVNKYYGYAKIVRDLVENEDYILDEKLRTAHLTEAGIEKIERKIGVENIYEKDFDTLFHVEAALKAQTLFHNDKEYIVADGEVVIVDEFTGRLLQGRRFSEGLHQAIEAKEGVEIKRESQTLATVSLQNFFRMYDKLAGMTGTAATESEEFNKIYKLETLVIPTFRPMIRSDESDAIYKTEKAKWEAIADEVEEHHKTGRPILIGTTSIQKNELLGSVLKRRGIPHELLNAKNHLQEAAIIARAGMKNAVTVATNMAGRGVDIILGGDPPQDEKAKGEWQKRHDEVVALGGLYVLGTEKHESRRIDNQLRGRAGRQGDPGKSRFFVSLEDDMMRIFGGEQIAKLMTFLNFPENEALSHPMVTKAMEQAQIKVESHNFDIRKHLVEYDDVLNRQREIIYKLRTNILSASSTPAEFKSTLDSIIAEVFGRIIGGNVLLSGANTIDELESFFTDLAERTKINKVELERKFEDEGVLALEELVKAKVTEAFGAKETEVSEGVWHSISSQVALSTLDQYWTRHLTAIDDLREGINLRGFAQLDPLVEYKNEAFRMFEELVADMYEEVIMRLIHIEITASTPEVLKPTEKTQAVTLHAAGENVMSENTAQIKNEKFKIKNVTSGSVISQSKTGIAMSIQGANQKLGRNDPCWCGSGKKFKKCHGVGAG